MKKLDEQTEYNLGDGLSLSLHEYSLKKLGLDCNTLDTDKSNELLELCDEVVEIMHDQLKARLDDFTQSLKSEVEDKNAN